MCVCVCACVRACMRACMHSCECMCVRACVCMHMPMQCSAQVFKKGRVPSEKGTLAR